MLLVVEGLALDAFWFLVRQILTQYMVTVSWKIWRLNTRSDSLQFLEGPAQHQINTTIAIA